MNNIETHNTIDALLRAGPAAASVVVVGELIAVSSDARAYFFSRADEGWLEWLSAKGFLDAIKQKAEDPTKYQYRLSELEYLVKVSAQKPAQVVDIMLSVDVPNNFNPEVVDRFLWISTNLEAAQLARVVPKILTESWVQLMGGHTHWGFEYEKMFNTLAAAKDHENILVLAQAVLAVRKKGELGKGTRSKDQPFYFDDLSQTGVFAHLAAVNDTHAEAAFALTTRTLGEVVLLGGEKEDAVFKVGEIFALFDVDFFTLEGGRNNSYSPREEVKDLAAAAKKLADRLIGKRCGAAEAIQQLQDKYILPLPDARTIWRFKLYLWSLCPSTFKINLKEAFFRIFDVGEDVWPIAAGAEYERALQAGFYVLTDAEQREYVRRALELFAPQNRKLFGYDIVSTIYNFLTSEEKENAERIFGKSLNLEHVPRPSIGTIESGAIDPQTPPDSESDWERTIPEIAELLKTNWTPAAIKDLDTERNFFRPINAEGVGGRLQNEVKKRLADYLKAADLFYDRERLDPHYTYSFLRGVLDAIKIEKSPRVEWNPLMRLLASIASSGKREVFRGGKRDGEGVDALMSGWDGVHSAIADLIIELLGTNLGLLPFEENREQLLDIIKYLLSHPDPFPENRKPKEGQITEGIHYDSGDPYSHAINTVRGRAFQCLVNFVYRDSKVVKAATGADVLSYDVKEIYLQVLECENTEAVMFEFGHYLATFYYRDPAWIKKRLAKIFPKENKDLFLASWEGYLSSNLFSELFSELTPLYQYAIELRSEEYTVRKYFTEIDEALATHVALAYVHFSDFTIDTPLFKKFWKTKNIKRHEAFVSFVGRHAISRENSQTWNKENGVDIAKLKILWDWLLKNQTEASVFAEFGFWINMEDGLFESNWLASHLRQTLEKSGGLSDWDYGMMQSLPTLAIDAPVDTIAILKSYLTANKFEPQNRAWVYIDQTMVDIFKTLYKNAETKEATYALIDELLPRANGQFWKLQAVLD